MAGPKEVILTWDKNVEEDVTHYRMYREPEWSTGSEYLSFDNTETEFEYVDYDVQIGDTYKYQLRAVDHADNQSELQEIESPAGIVEEEINPEEGGVVEYADLVLEIPEGAMTETGIIEAKAKQIDEAPESVNEQIGMIVSLNLLNPETKEVEEAEFEKDLTLTFTYDENELSDPSDELNLDVYYYDEIREIWIKIPDKEQDILNNTITVKVNHFTDFSTQCTENYSPSAAEYRDMGLSPFQSYFENNNEYVNPASGSLTVKTIDLAIPGRGLDLVIGRSYSTLNAVNKALQKKTPKYNGYYAFNSGWTLNIPWIGSDDNGLYFHTEDGAAYEVKFYNRKSNYYHNDKDGYHFLSNKENHNINIILPSGIKYIFDEDTGYLKSKEDLNGNNIAYDIKDGKINEIEDTIGRKVSFKYTADNMLDYIEYNELKYDYSYEDDKLSSYVDPLDRIML
ncbi:MAG: hypothetical protein KAX49_19560 [Halanaerobiales bacterium]|nr:hypothetical protein [Halanaerobiales bacterium]